MVAVPCRLWIQGRRRKWVATHTGAIKRALLRSPRRFDQRGAQRSASPGKVSGEAHASPVRQPQSFPRDGRETGAAGTVEHDLHRRRRLLERPVPTRSSEQAREPTRREWKADDGIARALATAGHATRGFTRLLLPRAAFCTTASLLHRRTRPVDCALASPSVRRHTRLSRPRP